jgi:hypothetical protein
MDAKFWLGLLIGFPVGVLASILASQYWEYRARWLAHKAAKQLVGVWIAYDLKGRDLSETPMVCAGPTKVRPLSSWWSVNAGVLKCESYDIVEDGRHRHHSGLIVMDPRVPWLAMRIDRYEDSHEVAQQQLMISQDPSVVFVFPVPSGSTLRDVYAPHAWRKTSI